jgi:hypothetical protein
VINQDTSRNGELVELAFRLLLGGVISIPSLHENGETTDKLWVRSQDPLPSLLVSLSQRALQLLGMSVELVRIRPIRHRTHENLLPKIARGGWPEPVG